MNKYKVAESIVGQIIDDLKVRMSSGTQWDVADEKVQEEVVDKWEDIIIAELDKQMRIPG